MFALVVHNSDEVKDVFTGMTKYEILNKLKQSEYWEDIIQRLNEDHQDDENWQEDNIDLNSVSELYHDGDSEDGYTLLTAI